LSSGGSSDAIVALRAYLAMPRAGRAPIEGQAFASVPLARADAATARQLLWDDYADGVRASRSAEHDAQRLTIGDFTLRYQSVRLGDAPQSLFISMHGGGATSAATNDSQWQNQIVLASSYAPEDALWIAPRAPTDDWNMWFKDHIDGLFDRLISNLVVLEGIDPNRVYVMGYSAGGDGVYQIGPRMADRWAGAAMSAGHPNDASPLNLRNVAFALHVGGNDSAFSRNQVAGEWGAMLDDLQAADPDGYPHQVQVHPGLPHWMELADAVAMPFVQGFERDPLPARVVWRQAGVTQPRFYWLAVSAQDELPGSEVVAQRDGQSVDLVQASGLSRLAVRLNDDMLDMDREVVVRVRGEPRFEGVVARTIATLHRTLEERGDPALVFSGEVTVDTAQ
jgi:hypothetical protein